MCSSREKQETDRKMDEISWFSGTKNALLLRIYLADGAAAQLEVLLCDDIQQRSPFFLILHPDPSKHVFVLLSISLGCFFILRNGVVRRPICLSQEALDEGALAAQVAHNCCR
jgi:hypothetical protein